MEKLQIKGNVVLWTINHQRWLLNYTELTETYITGIHPYTGRKLSTATLNRILFTIQKIAGTLWITRLKRIKNYRRIPLKELQDLKDTAKKLGSGRYAIVYLYKGYAVKIINHRFYKNLPRIDGALETRILRILRDKITYSYISPNIITIYQYLPGKKTDYIVLEKLNETFWKYLQDDPTERIVKGIIVQILFTLLVIQNILPGFRHNDLKVDNILLDFTPRKQKLTLRYKNYYWVLPVDIPIVKIADFDYASIPRLCKNPKVGTNHARSFGCSETPSHIYDLHLFLNSLYSYRNSLSLGMIRWLRQQLPVSTRGNDNTAVKFGRLKNTEKWKGIIKQPLTILTNQYFSEYRTVQPTYPQWGVK